MTDFSPVFVWAEMYLDDLDRNENPSVSLAALKREVQQARASENKRCSIVRNT